MSKKSLHKMFIHFSVTEKQLLRANNSQLESEFDPLSEYMPNFHLQRKLNE